jgi:hypothetical protein
VSELVERARAELEGDGEISSALVYDMLDRIEELEQTLRDKEIILEVRLMRIQELERALRNLVTVLDAMGAHAVHSSEARAVLEKGK